MEKAFYIMQCNPRISASQRHTEPRGGHYLLTHHYTLGRCGMKCPTVTKRKKFPRYRTSRRQNARRACRERTSSSSTIPTGKRSDNLDFPQNLT
ncbi:hypothetical protein E2C01_021953 [Portunus trituberculatus]|uniref:Uncharacterized protein n=1 Tax=Portunus trituberculatus TaxID=210409 RepID=A0A5B7E3Y3_PORTR|nr:hypothetical protein [Portunus trituberculatus]